MSGADPNLSLVTEPDENVDELAEQRARADRLERDRDELQWAFDELRDRHREQLFELAVARVGLRPKAIEAAKALIADSDTDVDDQAALERALGTMRREYSFLFQAPDIDAGSRSLGDIRRYYQEAEYGRS